MARTPSDAARNFGLDVLRAMAITLVVLCHFSGPSMSFAGAIGVEIFFVLSGYLIGGILYRTVQRPGPVGFAAVRRFWLRRWMRTLPSYYLFFCVFLVTAWAVHKLPPFATWAPFLVFLQNFAVGRTTDFFLISWSLAIEEWFYLLFPLVLYVVLRLVPLHAKRVALLGTAFLFIALSVGLRRAAASSETAGLSLRMIVVYRFDALMYGVLLAVIRTDAPRAWASLQRLFPLGAAVAVASSYTVYVRFLTPEEIVQDPWLLTFVPLGFALVLPGAMRWEPGWPLGRAIVGYVSRTSYSLYLCHVLVLWLCEAVGHGSRQHLAGHLVIRFVAGAASLVCAGILYRFVELPILAHAPADPAS